MEKKDARLKIVGEILRGIKVSNLSLKFSKLRVHVRKTYNKGKGNSRNSTLIAP